MVPPPVPCTSVPVSLAGPPAVLRIGRAIMPRAVTRSFTNEGFWALHLYFGHGTMRVCRHRFELTPGSFSVTPYSSESEYSTRDPLDHIYVHFEAQRQRQQTACPGVELPLFLASDPAAEQIASTVAAALAVARSDHRWAEIKLWDALVGLHKRTRSEGAETPMHPALRRAIEFVDGHLHEPMVLDDLARSAGISVTHLNRLFVTSTGSSAMSYVRQRRMELAHYLLVATGSSVKEIAYQVGVPDLHAFNKLCKKFHGAPPTAVRKAALRRVTP